LNFDGVEPHTFPGPAERHELHRGSMIAMVGERRVHGLIALNIAASLHGQLKGSRCQVFTGSMKVKVGADTILYPDVFVTCDAADLRTEQVFTAPTVVVEVLSPSTQSYDRDAKFTLYRSLPSVREYMLVDPDTREVQLFRRGADGLFTLHDLTGREQIRLESVGCELLASEVFDGVEPEAGEQIGLPV
jgi:Uma2 family endonuclease